MLLYGIIFFSVTSRPISPGNSLFSLFFFFCFTACHDLSKSNSLFESFFLFFFLFVRYDRNWPRLESIFLFVLEEGLFSNPRSFLLTFTIVKLPSQTSPLQINRATIYGKIDKSGTGDRNDTWMLWRSSFFFFFRGRL